MSGAGVVRLPITCSSAGSCTGTATLVTTITQKRGRRLVASHAKRVRRALTLGSAHYALAAGAKSHLAIRLSTTGLRLLKAAKGERLKAIAVIGSAGAKLKRSLTLVALKSKHERGG